MRGHRPWTLIAGILALALSAAVGRLVARHGPWPAAEAVTASSHLSIQDGALPAPIAIDYPEEGSIFPPEITPPIFLWHDPSGTATTWLIDVTFEDGSAAIRSQSRGERPAMGEIDPRCIAETNKLPAPGPGETEIHGWKPDAVTWQAIKIHSVDHPATVTIAGFQNFPPDREVSRGRVAIHTSKDTVGAPVFYRDVPLMPTEMEKGIIKPIVPSAVPLISWRLRDIGETRSRLLMEGLPTCANCHSFSSDGKTLGMDVDGPQNDKGMYAIIPITPRISIRSEDVFTWNDFPAKPPGHRTIGFMAQISPDGRYAVTTLNESMYVVNFKDYRFLQVFYPTRGILAWYERATGRMRALPGADNPSFVQTDGFWSPDGDYLVFARAVAKDPYPEGRKLAEYANDPNEIPIQYDLYRIPFNSGRGGRPRPIAGASKNGMSNTFPKVSPDGRWIVFVQCRNGQLMRPDGQLTIVPAEGGQARRMRCNTRLMNSWHSFSPNGRWMVFSSKSRSSYTQMFLTHLDEEGNDSPAILIEDATAANRAVNLPEFVNIPQDGLVKIDVPAADFYRLIDGAWRLAEKGRLDQSIAEWKKALALSPGDTRTLNNLGRALAGKGDLDAAIAHWQKALEINPSYAEARNNLGVAMMGKGKTDDAIANFQKILEQGEYAEVRNNLGRALEQKGKLDRAITEWRKAAELNPGYAEAYNNLGTGLFSKGKHDEAISHWQKAIALNPAFAAAHFNLGNAFFSSGRIAEALAQWRAGLHAEPDHLPVLNKTARVLATGAEAMLRSGTEAVTLAERAVRLSGGQDPAVIDTLAAAYAEAGRFTEALRAAQQALALATQQSKPSLAEALKIRIALYETGSPLRESRSADLTRRFHH